MMFSTQLCIAKYDHSDSTFNTQTPGLITQVLNSKYTIQTITL